MLSNCHNCQYNNAIRHHSIEVGCAIVPSYWQMVQRLHSLSENELQGLPIAQCNDFAEKLPYDLDDACIRKSNDGQWNLMKRIRKGWGETAYIYHSLSELLQKECVTITGVYSDAYGEFFTVSFTPAKPVFLMQVESSNIAAIGYDDRTSTLYIRFKRGTDYAYFDVPHSVYSDLTTAESKGRFFHTSIRHTYRYRAL